MKVLVTGGSGFLGRRIQKRDPGWIYASSEGCDLTDPIACYDFFRALKPDAIIHLAGRVGGIKDNTTKQAEFYYQNVMINTNVIHQAHRCGIKRVLSSLSTCCFPDKVERYPFREICSVVPHRNLIYHMGMLKGRCTYSLFLIGNSMV